MKKTVMITSGEYRGRELVVPETAHAMGSREKMALFNVLGSVVQAARVLDVYAGSGALGLEALSRGAHRATFVEKNRAAAEIIKMNIDKLKEDTRTEVIIESAKDIREGKYDVIFIDPPYDKFCVQEFTHLAELLDKDGRLVVSHPYDIEVEMPGLKMLRTKRYARAQISIFSK